MILKYCLGANKIKSLISNNNLDLILPCLSSIEGITIYKHYESAHIKADLDLAIEYIKQHYPDMSNSLNILFVPYQGAFLANMAIWKKELFDEYCRWLFDVLFGIMDKINYKERDIYQARVFGFLSERLFCVWVAYIKNKRQDLKILEVPSVMLRAPNKWFGWQQNGNKRKLFFLKIRIWKQIIA